MAIDVHAHLCNTAMLEALTAAGCSQRPRLAPLGDDAFTLEFEDGRTFGPAGLGLDRLETRVADMERQGVTMQVLGAAPMLFGHDEDPAVGAAMTAATNDALIDVARDDPERFGVMASLPMQDPDACVRELARLESVRLVRGVQIAPHVAGTGLDDSDLEPVWGELARLGLPALLHPAPPLPAADRTRGYRLSNFIGNPTDSAIGLGRLVFGGVLKRHPALKIGLVHGGGYWPYQTGRWDHGWSVRSEAHEHLSEPPSTYYRQVYCDSLTHDRDSLRFLGQRIGWDRVMIGTDYPFDMAEDEPVRELTALGLDAADEDLVRFGTAEDFLRSA